MGEGQGEGAKLESQLTAIDSAEKPLFLEIAFG